MKKILAFADFPSPYRVEVFKGLSQKYDLTVYFDKMSDQNRNAAWFCKNTGLNSYSLLDAKGKATFEKDIKNLKAYDLILAYDYHIKNAIKLQIACIIQNKPYVMNLDGAFIRKNPLKNIVKRLLIKNAAGYFASGEYAKKYFMHFGAKEDKIFLHPFTSLHENEILERPLTVESKETIRKELNIKNRKTVISIGQFIPRKGFDTLLNAWGDLDNECQLLIIGGGNEKALYEKMIKEYGYSNVFLLDYMPKDKLFRFYKAADVFALATREDIWGLVVNEALANGIPVVTTDQCLGGVELIRNGENGYIVPVNEVKELHRKIKELLYNRNSRNISQKCINSIKRYTYENVVEEHEKAIEFILNQSRVQ